MTSPLDALRASLADEELRLWPGLDGWLTAATRDASERWPQVRFASEATSSALARALAHRSAEAMVRLHSADLLLAAACAAGDAAAIAELDAVLRLEVFRAVRSVESANADDVAQLVRERLLVGSPGRIAEFAGDGPLGAWLRAVAVRLALNSVRAGAREVAVSEVSDQPLAGPDPELALLRARHRAAFRAAFARAVARLSVRERTVLRLSTLDGLTLAKIGAMYGKDASTVCRWMEQIRKTLLESTRAELASELNASPSELESMMRVADTELTVSLARLLASTDG